METLNEFMAKGVEQQDRLNDINNSKQEEGNNNMDYNSNERQRTDARKVRGTPFSVVNINKEGWHITLGNNIIKKKKYKWLWIAKAEAKRFSWDKVIAAIVLTNTINSNK